MPNETPPNLKFIAGQLRKPTGQPARQFAAQMDQANEVLYDLVLDAMHLQDGQEILEIGFGSGSFMPKLFEAAAGVKVKGLDYSPDMVALATTHNQDLIATGQVQLSEGVSNHLPYADGQFDKVFCNMVIFFWDQPAEHLQEIRRVLKAGGKFYTGFRTKATMAQMPFTKFGFHLYEAAEWQSTLEDAGFKVTNTINKVDPVPVPASQSPIKLESVCIEAEKV